MRRLVIILLAAVLSPMALHAQTDVDLDAEAGGRLALAIDKKLTKGLHLSLEEEVRMDQNFAAFDRFHTTLALDYKVHPNVKLGLGYALINPYSTANSTFKSSRHRLMVDAMGSLRFGDWQLSLKERFQATYRSGEMNEYQAARTALTLKSRLKVQYKGWRRCEPYAAIELRNTLNAPVINALYDGTYYLTEELSRTGDPGWFIESWNGIYVNRLRGTLGVQYRIDKQNSVDIALMADRTMDKVVDANAEGTKLKSYTREVGLTGWLTVGYKYSF